MWCGVRLAVAPIGDAIASGLARAVPSAAPAAEAGAPSEPPVSAIAEVPGSVEEPVLPRRVASRAPTAHRTTAEEVAAPVASPDGGAPVTDAPKATIVVPSSLVARALERRDVGATNAFAPDGSALGARLAGVSKYRTGLRDGDIVVSVAGTRTPNVSAMASAAMQAAGNGATRLSGRILRGEAVYAVVLELPK